MSQAIPKLLFVGAGNIAQSIIKGIIKARPQAANQILATAPTSKNLSVINQQLGCQTTLLKDIHSSLVDFKPDYVFLCIKPQVLMSSTSEETRLLGLMKAIPSSCTTLSLVAGIDEVFFISRLNLKSLSLVRVMLNTAAEIGSTSVIYHTYKELGSAKFEELEELLGLFSGAVIRLNDEKLMDVATGLCGSGIAFFYEMIQTISDIGVKNGMNRADATLIAAQLSKSAGEMLLSKKSHPYKLRDEVTSPAGTTIYGLSSWHENSTSQCIGRAFQASIDRAKSLFAKVG